LCIIAVPLISTFLPIIITKSKKIYARRRKELGDVNGNINEMFNNVLLIRAHCKEESATKDFDGLISKLYKTSRLSSFVGGLAIPMFSFVNNIIIVLVVVFSTILVTTGSDSGANSIAAIPSFLVFIQMFNFPFQTFSNNLQSLLNSTTSLSRIFAFLDEANEPNNGVKQLDYNDLSIHFDKVNFSYNGNKKIIDNFDLKIPYGQKVAIVGHTGSGKTTITNLLMRFYDVNSGSISIGGIDIRELKIKDLRKHFSLILQEP
jgi:ATP-binding cassette subfamily B protein